MSLPVHKPQVHAAVNSLFVFGAQAIVNYCGYAGLAPQFVEVGSPPADPQVERGCCFLTALSFAQLRPFSNRGKHDSPVRNSPLSRPRVSPGIAVNVQSPVQTADYADETDRKEFQ